MTASSPDPTDAPGRTLTDQLAGLADDTWNGLDHLSRALRVPGADVHGTLTAILSHALDTIDAATGAGVNLVVKNVFTPQAVIGPAPHELDVLQQRTGAGPCIDASREQRTVDVPDMGAEARWSPFATRAVELGVFSMLCVPLWVDDQRLGSLSLYAPLPHAFGGVTSRIAELYATHAALALADAQRVDQLRRMAANRDLIGQAKGVLMATRKVDADGAFALLVNASQHLNVKLVEVAGEVAATGELPGA